MFKVALGGNGKYNCFWSKQGNSQWEAFSYRKAFKPNTQKIENTEGATYSKGDNI